MKYLGWASAIGMFLAVGTVVNGLAIQILWNWFIPPVFGIPALTLGHAIGLLMVVSYMTYQYVDTAPKEETFTEKIVTGFVNVLIRPIFSLAVGFIVHLVFFA